MKQGEKRFLGSTGAGVGVKANSVGIFEKRNRQKPDGRSRIDSWCNLFHNTEDDLNNVSESEDTEELVLVDDSANSNSTGGDGLVSTVS